MTQREMRLIRMNRSGKELSAPGIIKLVDQGGISRERSRSRHILNVHLGPYPIGIAERIQPGLAGDAGASEDDDISGHRFIPPALSIGHSGILFDVRSAK